MRVLDQVLRAEPAVVESGRGARVSVDIHAMVVVRTRELEAIEIRGRVIRRADPAEPATGPKARIERGDVGDLIVKVRWQLAIRIAVDVDVSGVAFAAQIERVVHVGLRENVVNDVPDLPRVGRRLPATPA